MAVWLLREFRCGFCNTFNWIPHFRHAAAKPTLTLENSAYWQMV